MGVLTIVCPPSNIYILNKEIEYLEKTSTLHIAEIVRVFDHGNNIQLLCSDTRGLLSICSIGQYTEQG